MFDLSVLKIMVLGVIALVIFGPEQLPKMAAQAGQALRDLRRLAERARADLGESLGPEFRDFDINDLNPRAFVRKHLFDDVEEDYRWPSGEVVATSELAMAEAGAEIAGDEGDGFRVARLASGEVPPFDIEAT